MFSTNVKKKEGEERVPQKDSNKSQHLLLPRERKSECNRVVA